MIKKSNLIDQLPLEEGKTYQTKLATGETFRIESITWKTVKGDPEPIQVPIRVEGYYSTYPELLCPINADRLINETRIAGTMDCCSKCGEPIN